MEQSAMEVSTVLDRLSDAGVLVSVDSRGRLRIDEGAPAHLKTLVREHKKAITDVLKAVALMNRLGVRIIRLPLGEQALEYPATADREQIRRAADILGMEGFPLVVNDEGPGWITWDQWKLRRRVAYDPTPQQEDVPAPPALVSDRPPVVEQECLHFGPDVDDCHEAEIGATK